MLVEDIQLSVSPIGLSVAAFSVAAIGIYAGSRYFSTVNERRSLPPGPKPYPFIGNLLDLPSHHAYDRFSEWARAYGDIVYTVAPPGMRMVVINSYDVALQLLAKRPSTTGNRYNTYLTRELLGFGWVMLNLNPGPAHSEVRKMFRRGIGPQRVGNHDSTIEKHAAQMMLQLQTFKGEPSLVLTTEIGRLATTLTYGDAMSRDMGKDLSAWNIEVTHYANQTLFSFWLVDRFNFLRFLPSWTPGAYFKRMAIRARWLSDQIRFKPFSKVQELRQSGHLGHSIAGDLLDEFGATEAVRDALAVMYIAGADTMSAGTIAFYHALYLFPQVAQKVYDEIQAITDGTRLPMLKDRENMPYTDAVWKEVFRWKPFIPLLIPHVNSQDEIINDFLIPKGSIIHVNNDFILMDSRVWGDPEVFRPERFLAPDADRLPHPPTVAFGYGMRTCPGMYLADRVGFQFTVSMAALFSPIPLEGQSLPDPNSVVYLDAGLRLPQGFQCRFVPRSEKAKHLLGMLALES